MADSFPVEPAASRLRAGLAELQLTLDEQVVTRLIEFLALLDAANRVLNLTAIREPMAMVDKHLLDALAVWPHARGERLVDVGSGCGVPGIPLLLGGAAAGGLLIESVGKKARFLADTVRSLGLTRVEVAPARAEHLPAKAGGDVVLARALGSLAEFIRVAGHLARPGGRLLALKGKYPDAELAALRRPWRAREVIAYRVPYIDAERHLVILQRD